MVRRFFLVFFLGSGFIAIPHLLFYYLDLALFHYGLWSFSPFYQLLDSPLPKLRRHLPCTLSLPILPFLCPIRLLLPPMFFHSPSLLYTLILLTPSTFSIHCLAPSRSCLIDPFFPSSLSFLSFPSLPSSLQPELPFLPVIPFVCFTCFHSASPVPLLFPSPITPSSALSF